MISKFFSMLPCVSTRMVETITRSPKDQAKATCTACFTQCILMPRHWIHKPCPADRIGKARVQLPKSFKSYAATDVPRGVGIQIQVCELPQTQPRTLLEIRPANAYVAWQSTPHPVCKINEILRIIYKIQWGASSPKSPKAAVDAASLAATPLLSRLFWPCSTCWSNWTDFFKEQCIYIYIYMYVYIHIYIYICIPIVLRINCSTPYDLHSIK